MSPDDVRDELVAILKEEVSWEGPAPVGGLDRHFDSLQRMALVVAVEDRFRICLDEGDEASIETVEDLVQCIAAKASA